MDHKATLNGFGTRDASAHILAQNMAGITHDVIMIAELQAQLLAVDLRALRKGVMRGFVIWVIACALLFTALSTALIGAGLWLADVAHLSTAAALLWVAFGAVLLAAGLFISGWRQFTRQRVGLNHSTRELQNNLAALRQMLSSYAGRGSGE